jgi:queuosine precursor transporter
LIERKRSTYLSFHQMIIAGLMIISPVVGTKVVELWGVKFTASVLAAILIYAMMDIVNELWGAGEAGRTIVIGTIVRLFIYLLFVPMVLLLPTGYAPEGYTEVLESVGRLFVAGEVALLLGNLIFDIPLFAHLKQRRIKGGFFARTNISNVISTVLSTFIFVTIAFWGVQPIWSVFSGQLGMRIGLGILISPVTTLWVKYLREM